MQTLSLGVCTAPVQSHALTFVHMLTIPSIGRHTRYWTHKNAVHTSSTLEDGIWLPKWHVSSLEKWMNYFHRKRKAEEEPTVDHLPLEPTVDHLPLQPTVDHFEPTEDHIP